MAPPQNTSVIARTGRSKLRAATACAASCSKIPPKNRKAVIAASRSASFDGIWNENCEYQVKVKNAASRTQDHDA